MKYIKGENDTQFRVVNLNNVEEPQFQVFSRNVVDYPKNCVVEVKKADGSTWIEYGRERQIANVCVFGNCLFVPAHIPLARLWVRERDKNGIWYKVPLQPKVENQNAYVLIPGNPSSVELIGDAYFNAVFDLHRV